MTWIKIDDDFPEHPKVKKAGPDAAWLYVAGLCHAGKFLTDGFIDAEIVEDLTKLRNYKKAAEALVRVGFWDVVEGGYQIHDYLEHQKSRGDVEKEREAARQRQAARRAKSRGVSQRDTAVTTSGVTQPDTDTDTDTDEEPPNPLASKGAETMRSRGDNPRAVAEREAARLADQRAETLKAEQLKRYAEMRQHLPPDEFLATAQHDLFPAEVSAAVKFHDELLAVAS